MASVKLLLLDKSKGQDFGTGLISIRKLESLMIEITPEVLGMIDNASSGSANKSYIIKDNVTYRIQKTYYDVDNDSIILVCKKDVEPADDYRET